MERLIKLLLSTGKPGAEACERYLDLPNPIRMEEFKSENYGQGEETIYQICHFSDDNTLMVYALIETDDGEHIPWEQLPQDVQRSIINQFV